MTNPEPRASTADQALLRILERSFARHAGADAVIDLPELKAALGIKSDYLAKRMFQLFDANGDGRIQKEEFLRAVETLLVGTDREKLLFAFRLHDHDGDGSLSREEVLRMIAISLAESEIVERPTQTAEQLVRALFAAADKNKDGSLSFDELEALLTKRPVLLRRMTQNEAIWIAPNEELLAWLDTKEHGRRLTRLSPEGGYAPWVFLGLWALAHVGIFVVTWVLGVGAATSEPGSVAMLVGRALAKCADFDGALLLVPMMRRLLTRVRASWLGRALPIDHAIAFHKIVGHTLFALAIAHAASFVMAFAFGHARSSPLDVFLRLPGATGAALLFVFAVMWFFSLGFIRRSSRFELFYFTHLLYVVWLVLAIAHAPVFLLWAGVPILGFVVEQVLRRLRRAPASRVVGSHALRSGVTHLEVARPPGFRFSPGDYAFLRIPSVAKREWHPFTISSAPERDLLSFHVRSLGNWTTALRRHVEARPNDPDLVAYVDGPYGSPSAHIFESRYAVLIGAGIGVTPFASVLESLVLRGNADEPPKLEKAHFFWLNRDQYSFEWFRALLMDLQRLDQNQLLDVHLFMTGARAGATSMGLELAREAMRAAGRSDLITGLRFHTHTGTPDWEGLLRFIAASHKPTQVDVYFCGPPGLAKKLRPICERVGMTFREEKF